MRAYTVLFIGLLILAACESANKRPAKNHNHSTASSSSPTADTVTFSEPFVKDLYAKSALVARIKVLSAVKNQDIYLITAKPIEIYKGKPVNDTTIKYEAFLEEGNYSEFVNKELIIFLVPNKQDAALYKQGVHWGRTEPNVEFAYSNLLKNYLLKLK
jgi:hypothetical protein